MINLKHVICFTIQNKMEVVTKTNDIRELDDMSELAADKSKRKYLVWHRNEQWTYKYTLFYDVPEESVHLLDHMPAFKKALSRACTVPFLLRIQLLNRKDKGLPLQAILVMYTTAKVESFQKITDKYFPAEMNVRYGKLSPYKLEKSASSIEDSKPHNLEVFFGKPAVKRWSVLNKHLIDLTQQYKP